jgi:hypothetical protein
MRHAGAALPFIVHPGSWIATLGLSSCLFFAGSIAADAQFKEVGPPPVPATIAREQIRTLLEKVDPGNRQQTVGTISGLLVWYRDLIDEELVAAWQKDERSNLPEVIESLADAPLASAIVEFSWRQQRQAAFIPAYAPMLGHLMARYPESAKPFLDDLLGPQTPDLPQPEAEAVCRILLDMPDLGTWKKSALQILPHYRRVAENLLVEDIRGGDREKSFSAQRWLVDLGKVDSAFVVQGAMGSTAPVRVVPPAPVISSAPNASRPSLRPKHGEVLTSLDPALVDDTYRSVNGNTPAFIDFVNRSSGPVDIYWINYRGDRGPNPVRLPVGGTSSAGTFLTHPFLVVVSDTGGTTAQDTGTRLAAFQAVTPNPNRDPAIRDTAIIANPSGTSSQRATPAVSGAAGATLIHEYKFNGNANDSAGSANGELMNGAAANGGILTLNGANQYVQFASDIVPTSGSYSVALFAQEPTPVSNFAEFISQGRSGGPGFYIGHTPSPQTIRASDSWTATRVPLSGDGQWHSYVLAVDSTASRSRLFVDGIQKAALASAIATTPNGTTTRLGRQFDPSAEYFRGSLADVQIYKGVLSDADVVKLSASTPVSTPTSEIATPAGAGTMNSASSVARGGVILTPLNPAAVDDTLTSAAGAPAFVDFVNRSSSPLDIYWIDYKGDRVLYYAGLKVGATWSESTSTNHPWLVVVSGTGGTTVQDTGTRLAAFEAVTPNGTRDPAIRDTAIITNADGTRVEGVNQVPAPAEAGTMGPDGVYKAGNGVSQPSVLTKVDPDYSEPARKLSAQGVVLLSIVIHPDGIARDIRVVTSLGYGLDESR